MTYNLNDDDDDPICQQYNSQFNCLVVSLIFTEVQRFFSLPHLAPWFPFRGLMLNCYFGHPFCFNSLSNHNKRQSTNNIHSSPPKQNLLCLEILLMILSLVNVKKGTTNQGSNKQGNAKLSICICLKYITLYIEACRGWFLSCLVSFSRFRFLYN